MESDRFTVEDAAEITGDPGLQPPDDTWWVERDDPSDPSTPVVLAPLQEFDWPDGVKMPVSQETAQLAKSCSQLLPITKRFQRVYYACAACLGRDHRWVTETIRALNKQSRVHGMSNEQVRYAVGIQIGIFTGTGRFKKAVLERANKLIESELLDQVDDLHKSNSLSEVNWPTLEREAFAAARTLPSQAPIDEEMRWLRENLEEEPNFGEAPSRGAVKEWLVMHRAGNEQLKRDFLKLVWDRRMAKGDGQRKTNVFAADAAPATDGDEAVRRELFGGPEVSEAPGR
jgi:hypothetical protein